MQMQRKFLTILLLALLALLPVACGGGEATTEAPAAATEAATEAAADPATEAATEATTDATTDAATVEATAETGDAGGEATTGATSEASDAAGDAGATGETAGDAAAAPGPVDYAAIGPELAAAMNGDFAGTTVSLYHGLSGDEEQKFAATFEPFEAATGIDVNLVNGATVETIAVKVESGTIEDIVNFPQPGTMGSYARQGKIIDLNGVINPDWLAQNYNQGFIDTNTVESPDGPILGGVFQRINFKSAVWYPKAAFEDAGYTVPQTWEEMQTLMDDIVADGDAPWCIGMESAAATGWPATDWIEDIMLRTTSLENYDAWTRGELPFTSPEVRNAFQILTDIWFNDQYVYGGRAAIASTNFGDAPTPMLQDPPLCWLHRQGNFITTFFERNAPGVEGGVDYDFFYLPPIDEQYGKPVLYAGDLFSMMNDRPEVRALIQYLTTYESIEPWIEIGGGALSPHNNADLNDYTTDIERGMAESILSATSVRFDGSDLMPAEVGSGSFWKGITDYVSGSADLDQALETIQNGWANVQK